jgi:hypothetical protein
VLVHLRGLVVVSSQQLPDPHRHDGGLTRAVRRR